jgi:hypothetical protein
VRDGEQIVAVRSSSEKQSGSLFHSTSIRHLHEPSMTRSPEFAAEYSIQSRNDYRAFIGAIRIGRIEAKIEG